MFSRYLALFPSIAMGLAVAACSAGPDDSVADDPMSESEPGSENPQGGLGKADGVASDGSIQPAYSLHCAMGVGTLDEVEKMTIGPEVNSARYLIVSTQGETHLRACTSENDAIECAWKQNGKSYTMHLDNNLERVEKYDESVEWVGVASVTREGWLGGVEGTARCVLDESPLEPTPDEGKVFVPGAINCAAAMGGYDEVEKLRLSGLSSEGVRTLEVATQNELHTDACMDIDTEIICEWEQGGRAYKLSIDRNFWTDDELARTNGYVSKEGGEDWSVGCVEADAER